MSEAKWYILHTYSGYENKVANNIITLVENRNLKHLIEEVMVPTEKVTETNNGKTKEVEVKLYPSYVYVKMIITDESWYICRNTRGVTGFVGPGSKPIPLTDEEVNNLGVTQQAAQTSFKTGDIVTVKSGALEGFEGVVKEVDTAGGTVTVSVSMFGRETPATMELSAVEKITV
ncbi:MAG: transcription termination/antitermination protein NusG [Oscillospiraceae bacterium]|jgi:transcriptional antiterminator NusG|nr:transcription termination/antitermination protein NusG [Oscillospiraceae bacterium]